MKEAKCSKKLELKNYFSFLFVTYSHYKK